MTFFLYGKSVADCNWRYVGESDSKSDMEKLAEQLYNTEDMYLSFQILENEDNPDLE